jgi:hypothetical protein
VGGNLRLRFTASNFCSYGDANSAFYKISALHRNYLLVIVRFDLGRVGWISNFRASHQDHP